MTVAFHYPKSASFDAPEAACRKADPDLFFPNDGDNVAQIAEAKAVCAGCSVRDDCLAFALKYPQYGIWGGLTDEERRKLRRVTRRGTV
jgi:WhiB family redox-sensing transcriptional regulator